MKASAGKVFIVGAGPGDAGLLTLRGKECLEQADVVVYDALANAVLLEHAPRAEHIFAGKKTERHTLLQEEINELLVREAKNSRRVVRLKGGDPFVFGRGGEEALALAKAGIAFEVVPGVSSDVAVAAYAGIPVTHRGIAQSFTVLTGHQIPGQAGAPDLNRLALEGTLVYLMGVTHLKLIAKELIHAGREPETPAAVIEWGTYPRQRSVFGTLQNIHDRCAMEDICPPAVIVVGDVVGLHEKIAWYESRPLFRRRIVVTRARDQASDFVRQLQELGADIFEFPTIAIEPPEEPASFGYIGDYDWVVLTSVNGVSMLFERLEALGHDARDLAGVKLCVIGSATAEAVRQRFLRIDLMPEKYVAEELLTALTQIEGGLEGKRFLLPRADIARSFLPKELRAQGAEVVELVAYRTVKPDASAELADAVVAFNPDLITFTSSSTARNFAAIAGPERLSKLNVKAAYGAIGPITAETANEAGMTVSVEPEQHDIPSFVDAIVQWSRKLPRPAADAAAVPSPRHADRLRQVEIRDESQ
jgi:uroporphyrinogen III methyltransferase / synthase